MTSDALGYNITLLGMMFPPASRIPIVPCPPGPRVRLFATVMGSKGATKSARTGPAARTSHPAINITRLMIDALHSCPLAPRNAPEMIPETAAMIQGRGPAELR